MSNEGFDFDVVDKDAQDPTKEAYPYFQWHHGRSDLEELGQQDVRYRGGWLFNLTQKTNTFGAEYTLSGFSAPMQVKLGREKQACLTAVSAKFAILRRRFCWTLKDERGRDTFLSAKQNQYQKGYKGKIQLLVVPAGIAAEEMAASLFVLTAKATTSINLQKALSDHISEVLPVANRTVPKGAQKLPPYALYTVIGPAGHVLQGTGNEQSEATQPILYRPKDVTRDYCLKELYVGRAGLIELQQLYLQSEEWAHAWDTDAGVKGEFSDNPRDVWSCDDAQVDEFVRLCAVLKGMGEPLERLNAIARDVAGVEDVHRATREGMAKVIQLFEQRHRELSHEARMALQAPASYNAPDEEDYEDYGGPLANDDPFA